MNSEAAENCLLKGKQLYQQGNIQDALKWFKKSHNLSSSQQTLDLINMLEQKLKTNTQNGSSSTSKPQNGSAQQKTTQQNGKQTSTSQYTQEQAEIVKKILSKKDYYDIMGVEKNSTEDIIKRAYKKLAVKLHPDKNSAPKAQEAFKKMNEAYTILLNKEDREYYDRYGFEGPKHRQQQAHFNQTYRQEDFPFEDIFDLFMDHAYQQNFHRRQYQQQRRQQAHHRQGQAQGFNLVGMFPMLIMFLMFFSNILSSLDMFKRDPDFQLAYSSKYHITRQTPLQNRFYTKQDFEEKHGSSGYSVNQIYFQVDSMYLERTYQKCQKAQQEKAIYERYARVSYGIQKDQYLDLARKVNINDCYVYQQMNARMNQQYVY